MLVFAVGLEIVCVDIVCILILYDEDLMTDDNKCCVSSLVSL